MTDYSNKTAPVSAGIAGASGYSGQALVNILAQHTYIDRLTLFQHQTTDDIGPEITHVNTRPIAQFEQACAELDIVFLATPPQTSMPLAEAALNQHTHVIDLSGAFRLRAHEYHQWYQDEHSATHYLDMAHYGLVPFNTSISAQAPAPLLIANPGCYATCALMTLLPLLQAKLIDPKQIIIDAKSGVSGAGRAARQDCMFAEVNENFFPYKIGSHQHLPEITRYANTYADAVCDIVLNTQLLPLDRGLAISLYAKPSPTASNISTADITAAYRDCYQDYPLLKFHNADNSAQARKLCALKQVSHTPYTHIVISQQSDWIVVFACIDNLLKGAASQAVENFNRLFSLPIQTGLLPL